MRHPRSQRKCPGEPESRPHSTRGSLQLEKECRGAGPYPGDDELPGVLVVGINPLPQQGDEAHQVELVALCHDVLWVKGMRAACWGWGLPDLAESPARAGSRGQADTEEDDGA